MRVAGFGRVSNSERNRLIALKSSCSHAERRLTPDTSRPGIPRNRVERGRVVPVVVRHGVNQRQLGVLKRLVG
jgi:hypothetical protein